MLRVEVRDEEKSLSMTPQTDKSGTTSPPFTLIVYPENS